MANILYGIHGEGSGHWARSKEVIAHLQSLGHNVIIATSGVALANMKGYFKTEEIFGFRFQYIKGRVAPLETFIKNLKAIPGVARSLRRLFKLIETENINLVITDFEPISSVAANIKKIPTIAIDNMHLLTNTDASYPSEHKIQADLTKTGIDLMTIGAETYIVLSFFEVNAKNKKTFIVPPIVRGEVLSLKPTRGDYVVVYSTHELAGVINVLKLIEYKFILYGADKDYKDGNLVFKKFDQTKFLEDLAGSAGVLATAGFSLISEALYLGKPYFAWPVKNQFEQTFNAYHLERLGYGKFSEVITVEEIESFLANIDNYRKKLASYPYHDNKLFFTKLNEVIKKFTGE